VTVPDGYESRRVGGVTVIAQRALAGEIAGVVASHGTLYGWASETPQPRALRGRAPVYVAALPRCGDLVAVRHVWHGGLLAPLTGDRFRLPTRAGRELAMSIALRADGIATTEIVAYALYPAGPGLARVDVLTRYVPDAHDLGAVLSGLAPAWPLEQAGALVRATLERLAARGYHHPDLNVKNLLLAPSVPEGALVIDVDVMERRGGEPAAAVMARNHARLFRSIEKWRARGDVRGADEALERFRAALRSGAAAPSAHDVGATR
jgi:hypothetical protein